MEDSNLASLESNLDIRSEDLLDSEYIIERSMLFEGDPISLMTDWTSLYDSVMALLTPSLAILSNALTVSSLCKDIL